MWATLYDQLGLTSGLGVYAWALAMSVTVFCFKLYITVQAW